MKVKRCGISKKRSRLNLIREGARKAMQNKRRVELRLLRRCAGANAAKFIRRADAPREPNRPQGCGRVCGARHVRRYALLIFIAPPLFSLRAECCAKRSIARQNSTPCRRVDAHHKVSRCAKIHSLPHTEAARRHDKDLRRTLGHVSRKSRIAHPNATIVCVARCCDDLGARRQIYKIL